MNTAIQALLKRLVDLGCDPIEAMTLVSSAMSTRHQVDETAEKRRKWDRDYRRRKRDIPPDIHPTSTRYHPIQVESAYIDNILPSLKVLKEGSKKESNRSDNFRGTRLPPDWQPSLEDAQYANAAGFGDLEIAAMREEFVDYWISVAGSKARKASWPATWRRWIRTATERRKPAAPKKRTTYDLADELRAAANAADGQDQPEDGGPLAIGFSEIIPPDHGWKPEPGTHEGDGVDFHPVSGKDPPRDLLAADRDGYQF